MEEYNEGCDMTVQAAKSTVDGVNFFTQAMKEGEKISFRNLMWPLIRAIAKAEGQ